jgi:hypothetical protein
MSTFGQAASIFQLGFALNVAVLAIQITFRRTHASIATGVGKELEAVEPELKLGPYQMLILEKFLLGSSRAIRIAKKLHMPLMVMFFIALVFSFYGLVQSATSSTTPICNGAIWAFSVYAILLTPGLAIAYEVSLSWLERLLIASWLRDPGFAKSTVAYFKISLDAQSTLDEMQPLLRQVERAEADRYKNEFRNAVANGFLKIRRLFGRH